MDDVLIRGRRWKLHPPPDWASDRMRATGELEEAAIIDRVSALLRTFPPGVVVDGGAFLGTHAISWALADPRHVVHAYEPMMENRLLLTLNGGWIPNLRIHGFALSDGQSPTVRITTDPTNAGHARVTRDGEKRVAAVALDELGLEGVRLVKLDVEGHEAEALDGARETIERDRPFLVLEDWTGALRVPDGYRLEESWPDEQTYLYAPEGSSVSSAAR